MHLGGQESFSLCLSIYVYLHLFSVKRLDKNISNNIFVVDLFYFWYLSGQSYNYLLGYKKLGKIHEIILGYDGGP